MSKRLLTVGRDNFLWRAQCYEASPSAGTRSWAERAATQLPDNSPSASLNSTGQDLLQSIHARPSPEQDPPSADDHAANRFGSSSERSLQFRARAITDWDPAHVSDSQVEKVDWYSEYIARCGQLSVEWLSPERSHLRESRGIGILNHHGSRKVLAPLEDGSLCVWGLEGPDSNEIMAPTISASGILFNINAPDGTSSQAAANRVVEFGDALESVSVDNQLGRVYCATSNMVTEIDVNTLQPISQQKFAWEVTAMSRESLPNTTNNIAIGTRHSLHIHDPRANQSFNPTLGSTPEDAVAFLPNPVKQQGLLPRHLSHTSRNRHTMSIQGMAPEEPGPISILTRGCDIYLAGRFPSILKYDQRFFPRLEDTLHSGGRLSSLAYLPYPPHSSNNRNADGTLVACGEYGGRGSLELYSLSPENSDTSVEQSSSRPYIYKNRQTAASAKLLSVATHGTRIVFSDADGGLKWVERDGRSLVRRWNINQFSCIREVQNLRRSSHLFEAGVGMNGDDGMDVVRKIMPVHSSWESGRGLRGDSSLLIWTGERIGMVKFKNLLFDDVTASFERNMNFTPECNDIRRRETEAEYDGQMRRALERQSEEMYWMQRFGHGRRP